MDSRPGVREFGITIGRFPPGRNNAITDVAGVRVGHSTRIEDRSLPDGQMRMVRAGCTAILPATGDIYDKHLVAGGFVLNGIGEMVGLTQILEWGWLETPILLTNTMSLGAVHAGVVSYMQRRYLLGVESDVIIPVVGETDDSFLNDVRVSSVTGEDVAAAIDSAEAGVIEQGSVGAGTGMTTFDFAGGIGSSSRILPEDDGGYTLGVLVLSNFGRMRNLTVQGAVVGAYLDARMPREGRRENSYGSVIVVVATDAPLLSSQLSRLARRAALGLGRVGSYAASSSGEICLAFSTGNRLLRRSRGSVRHRTMRFLADTHINPLYEAVIECTEEAVLNAIFHSGGMSGRDGHRSPAIPVDLVLEALTLSPLTKEPE